MVTSSQKNPVSPTGEEPDALSVSDAVAIAKRSLENHVIALIGEVSEVKSQTGYKAVYFSVKDEKASMSCLVWMTRYRHMGIQLAPGMLVQLTGKFTVYAPKGRMNFDVTALSLAGEGDLRLRVANLAKKLAAEGLTDAVRKRPVPRYPETIGLVTSPRGAAVHDVLRTLRRRYPLARIVLAGVTVEGEKAPFLLQQGLQVVAEAGAEVILLVRGGGSFEDLMPFNDESLARAIAACPVPIVTGIGHEPDTSIADMVADVRASTPTGAAETVSPKRENLDEGFRNAGRRLAQAVDRTVSGNRAGVDALAAHPIMRDADMLFATESQMLDMTEERLHRAIPLNLQRDEKHIALDAARLQSLGKTLLNKHESSLGLAAARLEDLSPLTILSRGYAIARTPQGVVRKVTAVAPGDALGVMVSDGIIDCTVTGTEEVQTSIIDLE